MWGRVGEERVAAVSRRERNVWRYGMGGVGVRWVMKKEERENFRVGMMWVERGQLFYTVLGKGVEEWRGGGG